MRFNALIRNTEKVVLELHSIGERVVENARKTMRSSAERIVKEAQLNAPVDKHDLEQSIHIEKEYGERGRLQITVVAGGVVNGVNVDDYATIVHENYEHMGANGGPVKPGPGTLAKRAANPDRYIGEKFLERAAEDEEPKLEQKTIAAIRRVVQK